MERIRQACLSSATVLRGRFWRPVRIKRTLASTCVTAIVLANFSGIVLPLMAVETASAAIPFEKSFTHEGAELSIISSARQHIITHGVPNFDSFQFPTPAFDATTLNKICNLNGYRSSDRYKQHVFSSCQNDTVLFYNASTDSWTARNGCDVGFMNKELRCFDPLPACSNNLDDDGDGKIDMQDPGCTGPNDNDETDTAPPAGGESCVANGDTEVNANSGVTETFPNRGTGADSIGVRVELSRAIASKNLPYTRALNSNEHDDTSAIFRGAGGGSDMTTLTKVCNIFGYAEVVSHQCNSPTRGSGCNYTSPHNNTLWQFNGTDFVQVGATGNNWLAQITCKTPLAACRDGIDNDGDGKTDFPADSGCVSPNDNNERPTCEAPVPKPQCSDGIDNDGDGLIDFPQDPGCTSPQDNDEFNPVTADLSIIKSSGQTSVIRGNQLFYTVNVTNAGPATATNVVISDVIPSGLTAANFAAAQSPGCVLNANQTSVLCNNFNLPSGQARTFNIVFNVPTIQNCSTTTFSNIATVSSSTTDPTNFNNTSTTVTTTVNCPQVPQCSDGLDNDNDGATDFPNDFSCSSPNDNDETLPKAQCQDGQDNDGDGKIDFPQDPGCSSLQDNDEFNPATTADLRITKTALTASVTRGGQLTYLVTATNDGPAAANNVVISDNIPFGLTAANFAAAQSPGCVLNSNQTSVLCNNFNLSAGQMRTFNIVFNVPTVPNCSTTAFNNIATISSSSTDPNSANNTSSTVTTTVNCPQQTPQCSDGVDNDGDGATDFPNDFSCSSPTDNDETFPKAQCQDGQDNDGDGKTDFPQDPGCVSLQDNDEFNPVTTADLTISKAGAVSVTRGNTLAYTVTVTNLGGATANNVVISDIIPSGLSANNFVAAQSPGCVLNSNQTSVLCNNFSLTSGQSRSFTIVFNVPTVQNCSTTSFHNIATVSASTTDPNNSNNTSSTVTTTVNCQPIPQCSDGIDNDGDGATDFPADFSCGSPTDNDETFPKAQCQDGLDNDGDGKIDFPLDPGCVSKQDNDEFNPATTADLNIVKTATSTSVTRGGQLTYQVLVTNLGPATANNIVVSDVIPSGLSASNFVAAQSQGCVLNSNQTSVLCNNFTLTSGQSRVFNIVFMVPTIQNCSTTSFHNVATVSSSTTDSNSSNNTSATVTTTINCPPVPQCSDGIDNDGDGAKDFPADFSCSSPTDNDETFPKAQCQDGQDNDGDGKVDFPQDPGCVSLQDNDEFNPIPQCSDGIDNDNDGATDFPADFSCSSPTDNDETFPKAQCQDGQDNDQDGFIDFPQDPGCVSFQDNDEFHPITADLSISKSTQQTTVVRGQQLTYQVTVANSGPATANNIVIADNIPSGLTAANFVAGQSQGCVLNANQTSVLCNNFSLASGQNRTFNIVFNIPAIDNCTQPATLQNVATVSSSVTDPVSSNNTSTTVTTTVQCPPPTTADLSISKTSQQTTVVRGQQLTYQVTATNAGPATANNIVIADVIPAGLSAANFVAAASPGCVLNANQTSVLCNDFSLTSGQNRTFNIVFTVPTIPNCTQSTTLNNVATISSSITDPVSSNNTSSTVTTTVECPVPATADLSISKSTQQSTVTRGQQLTYIVTATNSGPATANNIVIADIIPQGLSANDFVAAQSQGCILNANQTSVLCNNFSLTSGQSRTFNIVFTIPTIANCTLPMTLLNTATISTSTTDPNSSNNTSTQVSTTVQCPVVQRTTLHIVKIDVDNKTFLNRGQPVTYRVRVLNTGAAPALNVKVIDNVPFNLTYIETGSTPGCSVVSVQNVNQVQCPTIASLAPGATHEVTLKFMVKQDVACNTQIRNQADVTADNADLVWDDLFHMVRCAQCTDGVDNDGDGAVDFPSDFSCSDPNDDDETLPKAQCQDGIDNDGDGKIDFPEDPGCMSLQDNDEFNEARANLTVSKSGDTEIIRGNSVKYTITVTNLGPDTAANVRVHDVVPAGMTFDAANSDTNCVLSLADNAVLCNNFQLQNGQSRQVHIAFAVPTISNCTETSIVNKATVSSTTIDPSMNNNESNGVTTVIKCPVPQTTTLVVDKTTAEIVAQPNTPIFYNITVRNTGTIAAQNVTTIDLAPAHLTFIPMASTAGCVQNANLVQCPTIASLAPGAAQTFTLKFMVNATAPCGIALQNKVDSDADNANVASDDVTSAIQCISSSSSSSSTSSSSSISSSSSSSSVAPILGCIDVINQTFDANGNILTPIVPFTYQLDTAATVQNDSAGRARFNNVSVGQHAVTQATLQGWTQTAVFPASGSVTVSGGTNCSSVIFLNRQNPVGNADLAITKTGPTAITRGGQVIYTITVTNSGTQPAQQVVVNDVVPNSLQFVTSNGASCTLSSATNVACTLGTMNAGATTQFTLIFTAPLAGICQVQTVQNTATVSTTSTETNTSNNTSATVSTQVDCPNVGQADLTIQKTGSSSVVRGNSLVYTLTVTNAGTATGSNVVVNDVIPTGLQFLSGSGSGITCTNQGTNVSCAVGSMAAAASKTIKLSFHVPTIANCSQTNVQNTATVSASGETNTSNNTSATVTTTLQCTPTIMGCIDVVKQTFDVNNNPIFNVPQFTFTLDSNRTGVNDGQGKLRFNDVPAGTHTVIETVPATWQLQSVTPANGTVNVVAGSSCATVVFSNRQITTSPDFTISKTDGESEVEPEDDLEYTITVRNNSNLTVTNVTVTDELPDEVNFDDCSNSCSRNGRIVTWTNQTFAPNEQKTYRVEVEVDEDADGEIRNVARVFDRTATDTTDIDDGDDDDDDDDDDEDIEIDLVKEASSSEVFPGGIVEYTLRIENTGDDTIEDITVEDRLPPGVSIIDDGDADERSGGKLVWEIDELEEGDTWTVRYRISVSPSAFPGEILRNEVTVTDDDDELDETESVTISVIGNLPQTGITGRGNSPINLKPIHQNASNAAVPLIVWMTLVGLGSGAGIGVGRKFFFGF